MILILFKLLIAFTENNDLKTSHKSKERINQSISTSLLSLVRLYCANVTSTSSSTSSSTTTATTATRCPSFRDNDDDGVDDDPYNTIDDDDDDNTTTSATSSFSFSGYNYCYNKNKKRNWLPCLLVISKILSSKTNSAANIKNSNNTRIRIRINNQYWSTSRDLLPEFLFAWFAVTIVVFIFIFIFY